MKKLIESIRQRYQPQAEATMMKDDGKMVHNCAKHVEHCQWGQGATIAEEHADPDRYGNIAWYDIEFPHGVERGVPTSELRVLQAESHGHPTKKAKKMAEAEDLSMDKKNGKVKAEVEDDDEDDDEVMPKKMKKMSEANDGNLANNAKPFDKVTHGDVIAGRLGKDAMGKKKPAVKEEFADDVDETVIHRDLEYTVSEAKDNYDAHFKAHMKKRGIKHPGELDTPEKKKEFFNAVDAGYKAKNEEVFVEAYMSSDIQDVIAAHKKAGNRISNETSGKRDGKPHHSFVVTTPEGKRTRHIYHGTTKKLETMSPAAKSRESSEQDLDDK